MTTAQFRALKSPYGPVRHVRLTDSQKKVYIWKVYSVRGAINCTVGRKPRKVNGWQYEDHDGVQRFVEGNWLALVPQFHLTAENYGLETDLL